MRVEKQQLIHDLLDDENCREATLIAGSRILRRRRHWRAAGRIGIVAIGIIAATVWFEQKNTSRSIANAPAAVPKQQASVQTKVEALTDDDLLALFPNTPVALATLPDGRKLLIFPRAGDEQRLVTKM